MNTEKKALLWLCLAHMANDIYSGFLNPIMPFIASKLGFTMAIATVIISISHICSSMLQPVFGFFADNILKRFFIFWGLVLSSLFIPLTPSAPNIPILILFMILGSLGGSFFHPQAMGFVKEFSKRNYSENMGVFISIGSLGFAFGPLLAALITQVLGLKMISYTSVLGLVLAGIMFLCVPKLSVTKVKVEHKEFINSFKEIFSSYQMRLLIFVSMLKSLVTNSTCIMLPFLWKSMSKTPFYIGFALFLFVFAGAIGSFLSPKLEKLAGSKFVIYLSMCMSFPLTIGFALTYKNYPMVSLFFFSFTGLTTMLAQPVIMVWAQKTLPKYKSIVSGFINGFCWGIIALCMSVLGTVAEHVGIIKVLLVLSFIPMVLSCYVKNLKEIKD